ncbi:hypothetical protein PSAR109036_09380 [Psychrobacter arenosus]|uniref:hypothetical protein n=1 Tax=Psychrobacter arenosus TaxID=256326 RepID=UPI001D107D8C|nr:hypothetical protein [Psychrobacter arenosus]
MINSTISTPRKHLAVFALLAGTLGLAACQTTPTSPVMQRANSTYETTGLGKTKVQAQQNALNSAKKSCGVRQPIVINDSVKFNGMLDERTGRMVEQAGSVLGAVLGTRTPNLSRDDDYEYTINFRCQ